MATLLNFQRNGHTAPKRRTGEEVLSGVQREVVDIINGRISLFTRYLSEGNYDQCLLIIKNTPQKERKTKKIEDLLGAHEYCLHLDKIEDIGASIKLLILLEGLENLGFSTQQIFSSRSRKVQKSCGDIFLQKDISIPKKFQHILVLASYYYIVCQHPELGLGEFFNKLLRETLKKNMKNIFLHCDVATTLFVLKTIENQGIHLYPLAIGEILKVAMLERDPKIAPKMVEILQTQNNIVYSHQIEQYAGIPLPLGVFELSYWEKQVSNDITENQANNNITNLKIHVNKKNPTISYFLLLIRKGNYQQIYSTLEKLENNQLVDMNAIMHNVGEAVNRCVKNFTLTHENINNIGPFLDFCEILETEYQMIGVEKVRQTMASRLYKLLGEMKFKPTNFQTDFELLLRLLEISSTDKRLKSIKSQLFTQTQRFFYEIVHYTTENNMYNKLFYLLGPLSQLSAEIREFIAMFFRIVLKKISIDVRKKDDIQNPIRFWMVLILGLYENIYPELYDSYWSTYISQETAEFASIGYWKQSCGMDKKGADIHIL